MCMRIPALWPFLLGFLSAFTTAGFGVSTDVGPVLAGGDGLLHYPEPLGAPSIPAPAALRHLLNPNDIAVIRMRIGTDGQVLDFVPLELPHRGLLFRVEEVVPKMLFSPGRDNGVPFVADIDVRLPISRTTDLGVVSESVTNHVESQMLLMDPDAFRMTVTPAKDLDEPLQLLEKGQQVLGVDEEQKVIKGETLVEFYVDPHGVPRLVRGSGEAPAAVREAAVQTVSNFRFSPPRKNGESTVVKGKITIRQGG